MINAVGREIPEKIGSYVVKPYAGPMETIQADAPVVSKRMPSKRAVGENKLLPDLKAAILATGLKDGMIISFHHSFREGDKIIGQVLTAIRGITHRIFHKHNIQVVLDEIVTRAKDATRLLGCTPTALAIGVGRSQFEATALMMEAMVYSDFNKQSDMEQYITDKVNESNVGPLGLNGKTTVLATFMKVGPQRASGVRVVAMRPGCCFEPRMACVEL